MTANPHSNPPGPSWLESLFYLAKLRSGEMSLYEALFDRYGDTVRLRCPGHEDLVFVFHPDDVRRVLCENARNYPKGKRYHELMPVLGLGLVNSEGDLWRRQRRLVQEQFSQKNTLKFIPLIDRHVEGLLARWDERVGTFECDLNDEMLEVTFNVAGEAFFGVASSEHTETIRESFKYALSVALRRMYALWPLPLSLPLPSHLRFARAMSKIHEVIDRMIAEYRANPGKADNVLVRLMNAVDPETGRTMSHEQLRDEIKTILMVGHETSSVTATWAFYLLARAPEARARLVEELDRVLEGRSPEIDDLARLPYLDMVFNECLRVLPSVPFILRSASADDVIGNHRVRAGSTVVIAPWVTHRHPRFWTDPQAFRPERFADGVKGLPHRFAFLPFGAGQRVCLGEFMGQVEGKLIVAKLLQRYEISLSEGFDPGCRGFISLQPTNGMKVRCRRRVQSELYVGERAVPVDSSELTESIAASAHSL